MATECIMVMPRNAVAFVIIEMEDCLNYSRVFPLRLLWVNVKIATCIWSAKNLSL